MNALAQIPKLVLMLSSNRDGEVVAAAHAISRTLKSQRYDWHDFLWVAAATVTAQ